MPEDTEVYDPDTDQWVRIEPGSIINDNDTDWNPEDNTGELNDEPVTAPTNCADLGKRHKFKDRATGITHDNCLVCGAAKTTPSQTRSTTTSTGGSRKVNSLDTLLTGAWLALGFAVKNAVPKPAGPAAGNMMQIEASVAGPKLHKALKKTPLYPYISIASGQLSWAADLVTLLGPPLLVGFAAARPDIARQFKPVIVGVMMPVLVEASKKAEEQAALLEKLEGYSEENIAAASALFDRLIGIDEEEDDTSTE